MGAGEGDSLELVQSVEEEHLRRERLREESLIALNAPVQIKVQSKNTITIRTDTIKLKT